jgi:cell division septal protein FtsQ
MARHFWKNEQFLVRNPRIVTNGSLSHDAVLRQAGIVEGSHVFGIDLEAARRRLEALPCIRRAAVERSHAGGLTISIEERLPVAWLACDAPGVQAFTTDPLKGGCLLDEHGVIFPCPELTPPLMKLPVIHVGRLPSVQAGAVVGDRRVGTALELMKSSRLETGLPAIEIVEIHAPNDWSLVVRFRDGMVATFGLDDLAGQWRRLSRAIELAAAVDSRIATINLITRKNVPVTFFDAPGGRNVSKPAGRSEAGARPGPPPAAPTPHSKPAEIERALDGILGGGT